jgi:hypothetical protein
MDEFSMCGQLQKQNGKTSPKRLTGEHFPSGAVVTMGQVSQKLLGPLVPCRAAGPGPGPGLVGLGWLSLFHVVSFTARLLLLVSICPVPRLPWAPFPAVSHPFCSFLLLLCPRPSLGFCFPPFLLFICIIQTLSSALAPSLFLPFCVRYLSSLEAPCRTI